MVVLKKNWREKVNSPKASDSPMASAGERGVEIEVENSPRFAGDPGWFYDFSKAKSKGLEKDRPAGGLVQYGVERTTKDPKVTDSRELLLFCDGEEIQETENPTLAALALVRTKK